MTVSVKIYPNCAYFQPCVFPRSRLRFPLKAAGSKLCAVSVGFRDGTSRSPGARRRTVLWRVLVRKGRLHHRPAASLDQVLQILPRTAQQAQEAGLRFCTSLPQIPVIGSIARGVNKLNCATAGWSRVWCSSACQYRALWNQIEVSTTELQARTQRAMQV